MHRTTTSRDGSLSCGVPRAELGADQPLHYSATLSVSRRSSPSCASHVASNTASTACRSPPVAPRHQVRAGPSANPASVWPKYSASVLMLSPASRRVDVYKCRKRVHLLLRVGSRLRGDERRLPQVRVQVVAADGLALTGRQHERHRTRHSVSHKPRQCHDPGRIPNDVRGEAHPAPTPLAARSESCGPSEVRTPSSRHRDGRSRAPRPGRGARTPLANAAERGPGGPRTDPSS